MRVLLAVIFVVEVVLPVAMSLARNRLLFFPAQRPSAEEGLARMGDADARVVRVRRPDGRELAAYDVGPGPRGRDAAAPAAEPGTRADADVPVVLFFHGNAGNIGGRAQIAAWFAQGARCRLLLVDYSGYGGNAGSPSEDELHADALAAYDHLVAQGTDPRRIVVYGESIGGAPALHVATERRVAGLVVQSGFSSLSSMALRVYPWMPLASLLVRGAFPNTDRIATLDVPVLVVHGRRDSISPFAEAERLHAAARPGAELLAIDGADHNDLFEVGGTAYLRGLGDRFRRWTR